jgi:hypothetical protein
LLWRPFDLKTWIVLAWAQFLASLPPSFWGGGGGGRDLDWDRASDDFESAWERLVASGLMLGLVAIGLILLVIVIFVLLWVSARAKFVFLDDVVHGRALIAEPWKTFRREGNSLFLCIIALLAGGGLLVAIMVAAIALPLGLGLLRGMEPFQITVLAVLAACTFGLLIVALAYTGFFLEAFVVPLMHRYRLGAVAAWRRFFGLFRTRPLPFLVAGLAVMAAFAVFVVSAVMFGLVTCCLGFLLLMVPYLSNVLLLPVTVLYRSFTLELLAQLDADLLAPAAAEPVPSSGRD